MEESLSNALGASSQVPVQDMLSRAEARMARGDRSGALSLLDSSLSAADVPAALRFDWGRLLRDCGDARAAEAFWRTALTLAPLDARILSDLAAMLLRKGDAPAALQYAKQALAAAPDLAPALVNLGIGQAMLGDFDGAAAALERARASDPTNVDALRNLVSLYGDVGRRGQASQALQALLRLVPDDPDARYLAGIDALRRGDLAAGWEGYASRWSRLGAPRRLKGVPLWDGQRLDGKRVLVLDEQAIGEQVLFSACLPTLVADGALVTVRCAPTLKALFANSFPGVTALASKLDDHLLAGVKFDYQVDIGSLPGLCWSSMPRLGSYLAGPTSRRAHWKAKVDSLGGGLKIGLSWRGGTPQTGAALRSIALDQWAPVLAVQGVHFVSLQYTDCAAEVAEVQRRFHCRLHTWPEALDDYAETAALVEELDLVISVATALVRLTSALGREAWAMVPLSCDWIYQESGATTPWLPSARLFRQEQPMQWQRALHAAADELQAKARWSDRLAES
jgi:Flp pilus assembly protein TadD